MVNYIQKLCRELLAENRRFDETKPTTQMLGRFQPFHDGHFALFKRCYDKTGQVVIMIRAMENTSKNPFDFKTVKQNIKMFTRRRIRRKCTLYYTESTKCCQHNIW